MSLQYCWAVQNKWYFRISVFSIAVLFVFAATLACDDDDRPVRINQGESSPDAGGLADVDDIESVSNEVGGVRLSALQPQYNRFTDGRELFSVQVNLQNESAGQPISVGWQHYRLLTDDLLVLSPDINAQSMEPLCRTDVEIDPGGSFECVVAFELGEGDTPAKLRYIGVPGIEVEVELLEPFEPEILECGDTLDECVCEYVYDECGSEIQRGPHPITNSSECIQYYVDDFSHWVGSCWGRDIEEVALEYMSCYLAHSCEEMADPDMCEEAWFDAVETCDQ